MLSKLLKTAAAGNAAGEALYVEDVFSTYLYTGTGETQTITNGIALGGFGVGTSTDFDGSSDYLDRSSTLSGATDGTTFTFSAWVFPSGAQSSRIYHSNDTGSGWPRFAVLMELSSSSANYVSIVSYPTDGTARLNIRSAVGSLTPNKWSHILVSVDMASQANSKIYINDVSSTVTFNTFTNTNLAFDNDVHVIGAESSSASQFEGKIAHMYMDYTHRDLTVEANRRNFIDANGGSTSPSTLSALSPILYVPMTEDYAIGKNLGTGGDFTSNGSPTIVQSGTEYDGDIAQGGLVWIKQRSGTLIHVLHDTERGAPERLNSASTDAEATMPAGVGITSFNSNGFTLGTGTNYNSNGGDHVSWAFRKAPKFFDVVTYTGDGVQGRAVPHNLGTVPGMVIVKRLNTTQNWTVWHKDLSSQTLRLNLTDAATGLGGGLQADAEKIEVYGTSGADPLSANGGTYVVYLFAHNDGDGEFGEDADQDIIKCGSYSGSNQTIDLGFEPQFIIVKRTDSTENWMMFDSMRGWNADGDSLGWLMPNASNAESTLTNGQFELRSNGFFTGSGYSPLNGGSNYIYIAIRRGLMKTPESGTEVYQTDILDGSVEGIPGFISGWPVDFALYRSTSATDDWNVADRLRQGYYLETNTAGSEFSNSLAMFDYQQGWLDNESNLPEFRSWMFRRAPGFFDVVAYTGTGVNRTVSHNLGVAPELVIIKSRSNANGWVVGSSLSPNVEDYMWLHLTSAWLSGSFWNNTRPTETEFSVSTGAAVNGSGLNFIAYLFATVPGVSKVGSYTGTGTGDGDTLDIDCGFSAGARFVLIKRTDTSGNWTVYDTERGINASADDKRLELNGTGAEDTNENTIEPLASGFTVRWDTDSSASNNPNVNNATYIFLAIA